MTKIVDSEPWRALPESAADLIEPELGAITVEILEAIAREVPEYARPLEGRFGEGIRNGVAEALRQFVALIREPDAGRETGREVYLALGRGELRQERTLDSLQAAYRVGARVAWRRIAGAGRRAELDAGTLCLLAEAIFAYIDELSADSVEGYAEAQSQSEGLRERRRHELVRLLMQAPPAEPAELRAAALLAGWRLPKLLAPLACPAEDLARLGRRLPSDSLLTQLDDVGCALLSDPEGPGRRAAVERACSKAQAALGPTGGPAQLRESWRLARSALEGIEAGALTGARPLRCEDHFAELLLIEGRAVARRIAARWSSSFEPLTERARERMEETALAYVGHGGNAVAMASALHLHPQTVRYRIARLRELLGDRLDDPDARFELEIALRSSASRLG